MVKIFSNLKQQYLLITVLFIAAFLRVYHIDFQSIWLDEIHTLKESDPTLTFDEFHQIMMMREGMGHMYFLVLKYLYAIFGYSTFTARMFSAFVGLCSVYAIYLLGTAIRNKNTGLIAALLLGINYFHISYSQEARPYVLMVLFTIISYYRFVKFIQDYSVKNAIWLGVFGGLIVNAHFLGLFTIFSQALILLLFLILQKKELRLLFFKRSLLSGLIALLVIAPTYPLFMKMMEYRSGWLTLPGADGLTQIFHLFLGNTELLYFVFNVLLVYYLIQIFKEKDIELKYQSVVDHKLFFGGIILFSWIFLTIALSVLKSYLSEPMILHRYFIGILPALLLAIALAIDLIRNQFGKIAVIIVVFILSLTDICVVKNYYNTVTKSQFRELTNEILEKNTSKDKYVSSFGWLMSYFLNQDPSNPLTLERNLDDYVTAMRNKNIQLESFWYLDGNSRPFAISAENQQFLDENFTLKENIEKYDAWTKHYISKQTPQQVVGDKIQLNSFKPLLQDDYGNMMFFWNSTVKSADLNLNAGTYELMVQALSFPEEPIQGENAHLIIRLNQKEIANYYLGSKPDQKDKKIQFDISQPFVGPLEITFDNDFGVGTLDRNAAVYALYLNKIK